MLETLYLQIEKQQCSGRSATCWGQRVDTQVDASSWQVTSSLGYLRSHNRSFTSPLMKTLDWSVETLGLDYNSTGICNHLFKPD